MYMQVISQLRMGTGKISCRKCAEVNDPSQCACANCGETTKEEAVSRQDLYDVLPESVKCDVRLGDPVNAMPNGYESCKVILDDVKKQAGVGEARQWVALGCDGQRYDFISKLIEKVLVCEHWHGARKRAS